MVGVAEGGSIASVSVVSVNLPAINVEGRDDQVVDEQLLTVDERVLRLRPLHTTGRTSYTWTLDGDALTALETGREDAMLRVLEVKAAAGEASTEVTDLAMRICGGAAFRKEVGVERHFRDARAATVMAPTTDVLYDFIGKAVCGLPLFG